MEKIPNLTVSIVTFRPDIELLRQVLASLCASVTSARQAGVLDQVDVCLVDNGPGNDWRAPLKFLADEVCGGVTGIDAKVLSGHGNVGYGRANNLALLGAETDYGLVLNPDVLLDAHTLTEAVAFMETHPAVVLLAPKVIGTHGRIEYLCKRYPSLLDLALRGFAPAWLRRRFDLRLAVYEMRDLPLDWTSYDIPLVSGCFMFVRMAAYREVEGFSRDFFMYFEDFDLSLRMAQIGGTAFVPSVSVIHYGGGASRKGWRHIAMFISSVAKFFNKHGWRWV